MRISDWSSDVCSSDLTCRFMFNDSTLLSMRKLKDGDGNYLWQPADGRTGAPATVLGYGFALNQAMDSLAAAKKAILFGDFNKYVVRRVRVFAVRRDRKSTRLNSSH